MLKNTVGLDENESEELNTSMNQESERKYFRIRNFMQIFYEIEIGKDYQIFTEETVNDLSNYTKKYMKTYKKENFGIKAVVGSSDVKNPPQEILCSNIYYENYSISEEAFVRCMTGILKHPLLSSLVADYNLKKDEGDIRNFARELDGNETINIANLDKLIFGSIKTQGVLFGIGSADPTVFNQGPQDRNHKDSIKKKHKIFEESKSQESSDDEIDNALIGKYRPNTDLKEYDKFFMIQFPKYTNPIGTVSCGVSHVLALTIGGEMYFWGREMTRNFQEIEDVNPSNKDSYQDEEMFHQPREIQIIQNNYKQTITQISSGSFHAMCLTEHYQVYSWGVGKNGRLGH